jgi:hypothetical protein
MKKERKKERNRKESERKNGETPNKLRAQCLAGNLYENMSGVSVSKRETSHITQ